MTYFFCLNCHVKTSDREAYHASIILRASLLLMSKKSYTHKAFCYTFFKIPQNVRYSKLLRRGYTLAKTNPKFEDFAILFKTNHL